MEPEKTERETIMDFDTFAKKLKELADSASETAERTVAISKLKFREAQAKSRINHEKAALGDFVYKSRKNPADFEELTDEYISRIDSLYEALEEIREELDILRN